MRAAGAWAFAHEARAVAETVRHELAPGAVGPVVVSGMLAEQLARELGAGAEPGAVTLGEPRPGAAALVRVLAGEPSDEDAALVRVADSLGVPVVIVQLWPQADWTPPFVLSPFVVECRVGEGFPVVEIADRLLEAVDAPAPVAARIPALRGSLDRKAIRGAAARAAWLGITAARARSTRPLVTLEQARMLARLRIASAGRATAEPTPAVAGALAVVLASGFVFRGIARAARQVLPAPVADAAVAAGGTFALARALRLLEARLP